MFCTRPDPGCVLKEHKTGTLNAGCPAYVTRAYAPGNGGRTPNKHRGLELMALPGTDRLEFYSPLNTGFFRGTAQ